MPTLAALFGILPADLDHMWPAEIRTFLTAAQQQTEQSQQPRR